MKRKIMPNKPKDTIRDGSIKATIWRNEGKNGPYLSTDLARSYQDAEGNWKDSRSFSISDLLKVGEVARTAYGRGREIEQEMRNERDQWRDEERERGQEERDQLDREEAQADREDLIPQQQLEAERAEFLEQRAAENEIAHEGEPDRSTDGATPMVAPGPEFDR